MFDVEKEFCLKASFVYYSIFIFGKYQELYL